MVEGRFILLQPNGIGNRLSLSSSSTDSGLNSIVAMKTSASISNRFILAAYSSLALFFLASPALAGSGATSTIDFGLNAALTEILNFIQGPIMFTIISLAIIVAIVGMVVKSQRGESFGKLAIPVVGGLALLNIGSILDPLGITAGALM